ncbi:helix-turn-helix domain-containing protein [Synechocystis sp. PCC 7339]|uniref:helix-turn-helix domain-containing protein n=1 Tax=Synechocystis sp. PCC 7339 TaxID=2782213 RepID=UPI001CBD7A76|nr:helix-turn-helix domain-containing protein [Synechocystis sp. PCC 7339]UAJ71769.1 helix-turn-helix domain-containing protein [Synechocystis sp. PCC 7339]
MVTAMSPAKLTDTDKQELVDLYRQTPATTTTLAERFGVSVSTVSRLLKTAIASGEYETLVQEKRGGKGPKNDAQLTLPLPKPSRKKSEGTETNSSLDSVAEVFPVAEINDQDQDSRTIEATASSQGRRVRSRRRATASSVDPGSDGFADAVETIDPPAIATSSPAQPDRTGFGDSPTAMPMAKTEVPSDAPIGRRPQIVSIKSSALDEIVKDIDEDLDLLDGEDIDDLDEEDDEDDEFEDELDDFDEDQGEEDYAPAPVTIKQTQTNTAELISILPLMEASMPKNCYLVVDRKGELIVRPLKEFSLDGALPPEEVQAKTLPVFDNHRVARRFSLKTQKVIRLPDASIVQKTAQALKSKGITRVFLGGQVYSL